MTITVIICSSGRPQMLGETLAALGRQTCLPETIIVSVVSDADVPPDLPTFGPKIVICTGTKGSCIQRNRALDMLDQDTKYVVFMDDDYLPEHAAFEAITDAFEAFPDVVGLTGNLLADGIGTGGITTAAAREILCNARPARPAILQDAMPALYGCNMAFRAQAIRHLRFDEAMPLYGWQEDVDFSARASGRKVKIAHWRGVHCGIGAGRPKRGVSLGYSQIANPLYLWRKGSIQARFALSLAAKNMGANAWRSLRPESWIDRRGRLQGNVIALWDIMRGRSHPNKILALQDKGLGIQTPQQACDTPDCDLLTSRQAG